MSFRSIVGGFLAVPKTDLENAPTDHRQTTPATYAARNALVAN